MVLISFDLATHLINECFRACLSWLGAEDVVLKEPWLLDQELLPVLLARRLRGLAYTRTLV